MKGMRMQRISSRRIRANTITERFRCSGGERAEHGVMETWSSGVLAERTNGLMNRNERNGRPRYQVLGVLSAAVFVFLAAAARTRIIAANFGTGTDWFGFLDACGGFADN